MCVKSLINTSVIAKTRILKEMVMSSDKEPMSGKRFGFSMKYFTPYWETFGGALLAIGLVVLLIVITQLILKIN